MNSKLVVIRLPNNSVELNDFTINGNMLVRVALLLGIEEFYRILGCFLFFIFVHYSQIVALRMEEELKTLSVVECLNCSLARRNLNETNTRMLVFSWERCVNYTIAVW